MLRTIAVTSLLALTMIASVSAQTSSIEVNHVWARATPAGAKTAAVYMTLTNKGSAPDRLMSVSTSVADKADVHTTINDNGVMRMRPVTALDVKPGMPTVLKPGGYHIMLMDLKGPLVAGQSFALSLTFEKAGTINATATVEKAGSMGPGDMPGMKM
ncbi:MAG TPA: copper chaperone PCu(A)C [Stellaceae bacterium]|nr:copper chaperone PCu(A)C [Stellaceae bacterium]